MRLAVLSGKGGAGKTLISTNLAATAGNALYIDCDVEEPNGRLFLKPQQITRQEVSVQIPGFDLETCTGCRKCVDFCRFNALVYIKKKMLVFPEVCHACGGCAMVCPEGAVSEVQRAVGHLEEGWHGQTRVVTGELNLGEASGVPVIRAALAKARAFDGLSVIDCPPGSACSVMESVEDADYCILVAEPTAFGFHNFKMVYQLVSLMKKPCGVVINKMDEAYAPLENFCTEHNVPVLERIPYNEQMAALCAEGKLICEEDAAMKERFANLLEKIGGAVQ